ncbi:MAG: bifunctional phosphoglucose/phosphomannose isomerase [Balneolaceae bacterium]
MSLTNDLIEQYDKDDMRGKLISFPRHWREAMTFTLDHDWRFDPSKIENICIAGMGGSAIGADLVRACCSPALTRPVEVTRDYHLPGWVGRGTLFVACSYSGNTGETLSALSEARRRGASLFVVTSGGKLLMEVGDGAIDYVRIPGGIPPRAALAYSFVPLFRLFQYLGMDHGGDDALEETARLLERQVALLSQTEGNPALAIAEAVSETLPLVYSEEGLMSPVRVRWSSQFEENAKTLSYGNSIAEMTHNEIVGWEQLSHLTGRLSVILLEDLEGHRKVMQRMEVVEDLISDQAVTVRRVQAHGSSRLARQFSLVQFGDWVSCYLAWIQGVDPTPITKIDLLKSRLGEL